MEMCNYMLVYALYALYVLMCRYMQRESCKNMQLKICTNMHKICNKYAEMCSAP